MCSSRYINAKTTKTTLQNWIHFYRPQRSWAKVIFSQACVKNSVHGGGLPQCMLGYTPPDQTPRDQAPCPLGADTPPDQAPPRSRHPPPRPGTHPQTRPPGSRHPPDQAHTPLGADTPPDQATPPEADTPLQTRHPSQEQTPPGPGTPPPGSRRQHTVNERPVRILLECILVTIA